VLAVAIPLLTVVAGFQLSDGLQAVGAGLLRGAGSTRFAFFANVAGHYLMGLPLGLWLGLRRGQGVTGIWWGLALGLTAAATALVVRFLQVIQKPIRPIAAASAA
jgi:MATE family multidrug resistance protein